MKGIGLALLVAAWVAWVADVVMVADWTLSKQLLVMGVFAAGIAVGVTLIGVGTRPDHHRVTTSDADGPAGDT